MTSQAFPLVTVGIPTFNRSRSVQKALDAVLEQDYEHLEVLISDNASSDETQAVCLDYVRRDTRVKYLRQQVNVGPTANFNELLQSATGELFMWLADDDWIEPDYVRRCVQMLVAEPDAVLVAGVANLYGTEGGVAKGLAMSLTARQPTKRVLRFFVRVADNSAFYGVFRRNLAVRAPLQNVVGGDWLFMAALAFQGKVHTTSATTIHRNRGGTSASHIRIADTLGVSRLQGMMPLLTVAWCAFVDIAWKGRVYSGVSGVRRLLFASRVFFAVLIHKVWLASTKASVVRIAKSIVGAERFEALVNRVRAARSRIP